MKILQPQDIRNKLYHVVGDICIVLNYIRHNLSGYKTPRPFDVSEIEKAIDYDFRIVERWNNYLNGYLNDNEPFKDKIVLELGPGPDLGAGLILLAKGAKKYIALDVHNLATSTPVKLYVKLFEKFKRAFNDVIINEIKGELEKFQKGENSKIEYIVDKDFKISRIKEKVDLVISQVAFEHFDNIDKTISELDSIIKEGGTLYAHVDMNTHTRWIKDRDPLNIYRFSDVVWELFKFKGSPNRLRVPQYQSALERNDWENIVIEPRTVLEEQYVEKVRYTLSKRFRKYDISEMKVLSFILMATKKIEETFFIIS